MKPTWQTKRYSPNAAASQRAPVKKSAEKFLRTLRKRSKSASRKELCEITFTNLNQIKRSLSSIWIKDQDNISRILNLFKIKIDCLGGGQLSRTLT